MREQELMLYAHRGRVRRNQIIADLSLLIWIGFWWWVGTLVYDLVNTLRGPAEQLNGAAVGLSDRVSSINDDLPSFLQGPLGSVGGSADSLGDAATNQADSVTEIATTLGWAVALVPIVIAVAIALYFRIRWYSRVRNATRFRSNIDFEELLARRAVMHQPLGDLARVTKDPLLDLREGRFAALARLELDELGIDPGRPSRRSNAPASVPESERPPRPPRRR